MIGVGVVGPVVLLDLLPVPSHLLPPPVRPGLVLLDGDAAVKAVVVGDLEPALQGRDLLLPLGEGLLVEALLLLPRGLEPRLDPLQHDASELEAAEFAGEHQAEGLLGHELRLPAESLAAVAVVVDVLLLLDLADEEALVALGCADAAVDEAVEGELVLLHRGVRGAPPFADVLHARPELRRDQRRVRPPVPGVEPAILALVEGVAQDQVDGADVERVPALPRDHALLPGLLDEVLEGVAPRRVQLEHALGERAGRRIDVDDPLPVGTGDVGVAERRGAGPDALLGLLLQALPHLLGEVVHVVLGHQDLDPVDELLGGARVVRQDDALLHEVDLDVHRVERDPVLQVAVEAVGLLDQQHLAAGVLLEPGEHLPEVLPPGALRRLHVGELFGDPQAVLLRVAPEELLLGRDAEALLLLVA
ncbi:MAG: hypothetical protein V4850_21090 [Myxococcota bacterium]